MILSRRRPAGIAMPVAAALALVTACGDSAGTGSPSDSPASSVVATTSIWANITSEVLCGREVPAIVPAGADPHTFELALRDRATVERAQVVVANGGGLDGAIVELASAGDATVLEVATPSLQTIDGDPHIWQNPELVARAVVEIEAAIQPLELETCTDTYLERLERLDRDIVDLLAPIPAERRVLVTSHDSLAYFADRYDLEIVGTVIPSTNTLAESNAADLADLADAIAARNVGAIFTEQLESTTDTDALAARLGVRVVSLVTDALTDDEATDTYLEMMRFNAEAIADALGP